MVYHLVGNTTGSATLPLSKGYIMTTLSKHDPQWISTPSHEYLSLPIEFFVHNEFLRAVATDPSILNVFGYGYRNETHIFLEGDCEATAWLDACNINAMSGIDPNLFESIYSEAFDHARNVYGMFDGSMLNDIRPTIDAIRSAIPAQVGA